MLVWGTVTKYLRLLAQNRKGWFELTVFEALVHNHLALSRWDHSLEVLSPGRSEEEDGLSPDIPIRHRPPITWHLLVGTSLKAPSTFLLSKTLSQESLRDIYPIHHGTKQRKRLWETIIAFQKNPLGNKGLN